MASQLQGFRLDQPRSSTETDRRHLLASSVAPSETASIRTSIHSGEQTPRAHSPTQTGTHAATATANANANTAAAGTRHQSIAAPEAAVAEQSRTPRPYRGFPSEQAYLDALKAWAENRRFVEPGDTTLVGFYGATTMEEYAGRPPAFEGPGLVKKWRARRAGKAEERRRTAAERRATVA